MTSFPGSGALRRARRWLVRRGHAAGDGGFILLESIIAIAVITVIMGAVGAEFVSGVISTSQQRTQQGAVQVADSVVEQIRALHPSDLVTGRDAASVTAQFKAAPAAVQPWLANLDQAVDAKATPGSGASAAIPTAGVVQQPGSVSYTVNEYLGSCSIPGGVATDCVAPSSLGTAAAKATPYLRAVVAVTWSGTHCGSSSCTYVTSTLISATSDPTFRINAAPYSAPVIVAQAAQVNAIGDQVSLQLKVQDGTGVPPTTWAVSTGSLPSGLTLSPTGLISGTVAGPPGTYSATVQVTDAFLRTDTQAVTWTVEPAIALTDPGLPNHPGQLTNTTSDTVSVTLQATGGDGAPYTFSDPTSTLPPGLSLSAAGLVTGRPTTVGSYSVQIKIGDSSGTRFGSGTFTWTIGYPPLVAGNPGAQASTVNTAIIALQLSATGGSGGYVWTDPAPRTLPAGLSISSGGLITGTPTATNGSGTTVTLTVTDPTAGSTTTVSFVWTVYPAVAAVNPGSQLNTVSTAITALQLNASGGSGNYVWTDAAARTLPAGLTLTTAGRITGSPTATGTSTVTLTVTDLITRSAKTISFSWVVAARPTVTAPANQIGSVGASVSLQLSTSCPNTPCSYVFGGTAPTGLTISSTGLISGTVGTPAQPFTGITVVVTDHAGATATSGSFSWTIYPVLAATNPGPQASIVNTATAPLQLAATGGSGSYVWTDASPRTLPAGLSISSGGLVTGTPTATNGAGTTVTLTVTDLTTGSAKSVSFTWTVSYPPLAASNPGAQADTVNTPITPIQLSATGGSGAYVWTDASPRTLPAGLSISSGGLITGTPTATGTSTVTLTVTDLAAGSAKSVSFTWAIYSAVTAVNPGSQLSTVGTAITALQLSASGGSGSYTWADAGTRTLPAGLTLTTAGRITGTPTAAGTSTVTLTATDPATGSASTISFSWVVDARPTVTAPANESNSVGATVSLQLSTSCPNTPCSYVFGGTAPTGLTISSTGLISGTVGTPAQPFTGITVVVTDHAGATATSSSFTWTVYPQLTATNPGPQTSIVNTAITALQLSATGGSGNYVWTDASPRTLPAGFTLTTAGRITGTPTATGTSTVTLTLSDPTAGSTSTFSFAWTVSYPPLVANNPGTQASTVSTAITPLQLSATGGSGTSTWADASPRTLPVGLTLTTAGRITGTPTATGTSTVTLTVTDSAAGSSRTISFSWVVSARPTVTAPANQTTSVGVSVSLQLTTSCPNTPCAYVFGGTAPTGLTISSTGLISGTVGTPAQPFTGITIVVTDHAGATATSSSFSWTVYPQLTAANPGSQESTVNTAITALQLSATGGSGSYTWADGTTRTLPAGLTLTTAGRITGTPTATGSSTVTLTLSDGTATKTVSFTWAVDAKPTVTALASQATTVGGSVSVQVTTTCANDPCSYVFGSTAPSGLTISNTGLITGTVGTPVQPFTGITVTVTDHAGATATSGSFSWTVNRAPTMGSPGNQTTHRGAAVSLDVSGLDSGGTPGYTYGATGLPAWLSIDTSTGKITGTAPATANSTTTGIKVSVSDGSGISATSATFTWNVTDLASSFKDQTSSDASAVSLDLDNYTTGGTGPYTYTASGLPSWLSLNSTNGVISGTSPNLTNASTKTAGITITVTDSKGAVVTLSGLNWYNTDIAWSVPSTIGTGVGTNLTGYSAANYLTGGATTKTYSAVNLPIGLTMNSSGAVTGSTNTRGTFNTVFSATDSVGATKTTAITWTVS